MKRTLTALLILAAAAAAVPVADTTQAGKQNGAQLGPLRWKIVGAGERCPATLASSGTNMVVTTRQAICVSGLEAGDYQIDKPFEIVEPLPPAADEASGAPTTTVPQIAGQPAPQVLRLAVVHTFTWDEQTLPKQAVAVSSASSAAASLEFTLQPDVIVTTEFVGPTAQGAETVTTNPANVGTAVPAEGGETTEAEAVVDDSITVTGRQTTKTVTIQGSDSGIASVPGMAIVESVNVEGLKASQNGTPLEIVDNSYTIPLDVGGQVTYKIHAEIGQYNVRRDAVQTTQLTFNGLPIASTTRNLILTAPQITVEASAPPSIRGTEGDVTVTVKSSIDTGATFTVRLRPDLGGSLIRRISPSDNGVAEQNTTTWTLSEGLVAEKSIVRTVRVTLDPTESREQLTWKAELFDDANTVIGESTATSDIPGQDSSGSTVDFTPGQLIQLIAFVMALALMAIIFGAWRRSRSATVNDVDMFRAFAETILVLVILVAILVLALRGSLNGESAASLIGVIAGYALGKSRQSG